MSAQPITITPPPSETQSEISSLSQNVQLLNHRGNLANNVYIVFLALTLISTILIVRFNGKLNAARNALEHAKDSKLASDFREKDLQIADALKKQTEAELSLLKLRRFVSEPRTVDRIKSKALLENRPKGSVEIKYLDGVETERFAKELQKNLADNGWKTSIEKVGTNIISNAGVAVITGSKRLMGNEISLDESGRPKFFQEPGQTLITFLDTCVESAVGGWWMANPQLAKDTSAVLIGPKVW